jgi:hypothetical protein
LAVPIKSKYWHLSAELDRYRAPYWPSDSRSGILRPLDRAKPNRRAVATASKADTPVTRIASLLAAGIEIACGLGYSDNLVAISHECDHPPEIIGRPRATRAHFDDRATSNNRKKKRPAGGR